MSQTIISVFVLSINKLFIFQNSRTNRICAPARNEVRRLRKDPSQMKSFDPDWVLRFLLKTHPEYFAQRDIKQVLADCIPHDYARVMQSRVVSYDWYWIVELLPGHSPENENHFAYVVGWFDPQLHEPVTHIKAWFFRSREDALSQ